MGDVRSDTADLIEDEYLAEAYELARLWGDFEDHTAPVFRSLIPPARYKGAYGGRGSGKSHFFAEYAVTKCKTEPGTRIVCVREVQKSLRESVKLLIEDKIRTLGFGAAFEVRHDFIRTPGDGLIIFQGMQDHTAESVKSLEGFDIAYCEEAQTITERSLEMLRPTIRKTDSELWFSWNPRHSSDPVDQLLRGMELPPDAAVVRSNYPENPYFPDVLEKERQFDRVNNPQRYEHIWRGAYEPQAIGAIWTREMIHRNRVAESPSLERIIIAVDPAITAEKGSNETGIIACGMGPDRRGYVIADVTCVGQPEEWARRAVNIYDELDADAVVVETNQGGDMVRAVLHAVRPGLPIIQVTATRGKHVRAEPISALYAVNKISHVGAFPDLEHQMCLITAEGYQGEGSPDRADALVWGFTSLFGKLTQRTHDARSQFKVVHGTGRRMTQKSFMR